MAVAALLVLLAGCSPDPGQESAGSAVTDRVAEVHDSLIAIDTHIDIPFEFATKAFDPGQLNPDRQVDLPRMREGGLHAGFFVVYMPQAVRTAENYEIAVGQSETKFQAIHRMVHQYPDQIELAYSADDVRRIHASGKLVALIGIENGFGIGPDIRLLEDYAAQGARYITLAHIGHNDIADSSMPRPELGDLDEEHGGLSDFGREVIGEMNRVGIAVDVSHISKAAMLQATAASAAPVMASHSGISAIHPHPRNLDDEQLMALRDSGGVVQVVAFDSYLRAVPEAKREAIGELLQELGMASPREARGLVAEKRAHYDSVMAGIHASWPRADVSTLVDHIDYAVGLIGIDYVGISSDFQGGGGIDGWDDASETKNVTAELLRRGYSDTDIRKIWGENLLRVMEDVERVASER